MVLLPETAETWPESRRHVVLLHELAHIKRQDCLVQMLVQLVCALYWFNPMVWYAARQLRIERELACDDAVIQVGTVPAEYATHILTLAGSLRSIRPHTSGNPSDGSAIPIGRPFIGDLRS